MEKEGLVTRVPKRKGHPFTEVKITSKGEKVTEPGVKIYKGLIKGLVAGMSVDDQKQLQKLLRVLRDKMLDDMHMELDKPPDAFPPGKPIHIEW